MSISFVTSTAITFLDNIKFRGVPSTIESKIQNYVEDRNYVTDSR